MESLTKHQLVLVALLVSFVTSLATGIVTVALMDQAPAGVTRTITQVIQQTVADATGSSNSGAVAISVSDQVADATAKISSSLVQIRNGDIGPVLGLGLIVSSSGTLMTDKGIMNKLDRPEAIYPNGKVVPIYLVRFQADGDVAFFAPVSALQNPVKAITFGSDPKLGSTIWSLSGTTTYTLSQGIVSQIDMNNSSADSSSTPSIKIIHTSLLGYNVMLGAPLFDASGSVIGLGVESLESSTSASFYPLQGVKEGVPE